MQREGESVSNSPSLPRRIGSHSSIESLTDALANTPPASDCPTPVWCLVLTGGPCGGKTTALSLIADRLRSLGTQVFTVPENATLFTTAGAGFPVHSNHAHQLCWETSRMICQMEMENCFINIARSSQKPTVVLCDRGVMDARAYMDEETWREVLGSMGWVEDKLVARYDMTIHMVSTAIGARQYYVNTVYRHETPQQASELDDKIQHAWRNHPHRKSIDNSTGFDQKVKRVVDSICTYLGLAAPGGQSSYVGFKLQTPFNTDFLPDTHETYGTHTIYLQNSSAEKYQFVRMRKQNDATTYACGRKETDMYTECLISHKEFFAMLVMAHPQMATLELLRKVWVDGGRVYELFMHSDFTLLKVEVCTPSTRPTVDLLPSWLRPQVLEECPDIELELFDMARKLYAGPEVLVADVKEE